MGGSSHEGLQAFPRAYLDAVNYIWQAGDRPAARRMREECLERFQRVKPKEGLPLHIFVLGVEGSGHHFVANMLRNNVSLIFNSRSSHHVEGITPSTLKRSKKSLEHRFRQAVIKRVKKDDVILEMAPSFPLGEPYRATRHPDVLSLLEYDGKLIDLRIILPVRKPVDAVMSTFHSKGWTGERARAENSAAITAHCLTFINNMLYQLPCGKTLILPLNFAYASPKEAMEAIDVVAQLSERQRKLRVWPSSNVDLDTNANSWIDQIFRPRKRKKAFSHNFDWLKGHVHSRSSSSIFTSSRWQRINDFLRRYSPSFPLMDPEPE